jgi:hypothetical protein
MLLVCRLAGLSALETHHAGVVAAMRRYFENRAPLNLIPLREEPDHI